MTISENDPLYRKYAQEVLRRGDAPAAYEDFRQRLHGRSDFDFASLFLPAPPAQPLAVVAVAGPKFPLGQVCITPGAAAAIPPDEVCNALRRHAAGDWGTLDADDRQENERAIQNRGRLVSVFKSSTGREFYVITDAGWQTSTLLLPEEY